MNRRSLLAISAALLPLPHLAFADAPTKARLKLIKDPNCGCCGDHAQYLRSHGYDVEVSESTELATMRSDLGVPTNLVGCHLILTDDYVIEGHVPAAAVDKLLAERPRIRGISVPGMPVGSPGMSGAKTEPLVVWTIEDGAPQVFLTE